MQRVIREFIRSGPDIRDILLILCIDYPDNISAATFIAIAGMGMLQLCAGTIALGGMRMCLAAAGVSVAGIIMRVCRLSADQGIAFKFMLMKGILVAAVDMGVIDQTAGIAGIGMDVVVPFSAGWSDYISVSSTAIVSIPSSIDINVAIKKSLMNLAILGIVWCTR